MSGKRYLEQDRLSLRIQFSSSWKKGRDMVEKGLLAAVNRRDFLKMAGLATGTLAAFPLQAHARFLFDGRPPLKVGIVVPRSAIYPDIAKKLVDGIRLQFAESGWESTRLLVREAVNGAEIAAAIALISEDRVGILTGMFNPLTVHRLREGLESSGTLFINIEGGANSFVPREESPLMYQNSLGYWQSNWAMGKWAAENMGRRAAVASSFYETGYDSFYAFPQGFESSGGTILRTDITHAPMGTVDLGKTMEAIAAVRPDFVFASSSGRDSLDFVSAYHASRLSARIPLVASGFMMHDALLSQMGGAAHGIISCLPWTATLDTPVNSAFCAGFASATGAEPDSFAVLGYDTGSMIVSAVASAAGRVHSNQDLKKALENLRISSPRGTLDITALTGSSNAPLYICEVRQTGNSFRNTVVSRASSLQAVEREAHLSALVARSGWTNGYLCA